MDNLAINDQSQVLSQYSRHQIDRTYADQHESVLGHLICERGRSVKAALEDLRPIVAQTRRETLSAVDWCQKLGFGGVGVGVLVGAGLGMGFAILPILAGTISIKCWADSRAELPRRDAEYHLLKTTPNLPEALYALHLRGVTAVKIVGAYDQLVAAIEARLEGNGEFTEADVGEFLKVKVSSDMGLEMASPATEQGERDTAIGTPQSVAQTVLEGERDTAIGHFADASKMVTAAAPSMQHITSPAWNPADSGNKGTVAAPSMQSSNGAENWLNRVWQVIDRNKNFFVGGNPGSGKGVMVSNLIRRKLDQYPGSIAVWIDPKGSTREDGNFADPRITRLAIKGVGMSRSEYAIEVAEMLEQAREFIHQCDIENGKRVWIVFDEVMNIKQKLDKKQFADVQDLLVDCVSMGDDSGLHVIAITQSFNAGDTVGSDELLKNLALIACLKEDDYPRAKKLVQFGKTNHDDFSNEEYSKLVRKSPRDRVICIGGTFIPAPEMPILCGWDRDKGAKVSTPSQSPVVRANESTFQGEAIASDNDDYSHLPDLFDQVATIALVSKGDTRLKARQALESADFALKQGDKKSTEQTLIECIKTNA
jgi:hypothetical protein